jgi:hypothetical protein
MLTARPESAELRRLMRIYRALGEEDRSLLVAFAELMAARRVGVPAGPPGRTPEPVHRPRPAGESVIAAIRRLSLTYPMLERGDMLNETSALMSAHVLQGRDATLTIDALEALFARHYEAFRSRAQGTDGTSDRSA